MNPPASQYQPLESVGESSPGDLFRVNLLQESCLGQVLGRYGLKKEPSPDDLFGVSLSQESCLGQFVSGQIRF